MSGFVSRRTDTIDRMAFEDVELPDVSGMSVGILGGTGAQGRGLAYRFARAGHAVNIGSRSADRAKNIVEEIKQLPLCPDHLITGGDNEAACASDLIIIAVPWDAHADTLRQHAPLLAGKIVIDCVNPLGFDKKGAYPLPVAEGSAAAQAEQLLPDSRVTAAFHHVSAVLLSDHTIDNLATDILVLGDDREAALIVQALAGQITGMRGVYAGRIRNAGQVEAMTANLIAINRRYRAHVGLRVGNL